MENPVEKRAASIKEKLFLWLKDKYNLLFLAIVLFAFAVRIYYFFQTVGQTLWWDEAEYMNMARAWAYNLNYNYWVPVRPVLFSFIASLLFRINPGELLPRLFMLFLSMGAVVGVYMLGKELFNKKVGLISAFFMSVFYLALFHTCRLLVDLPSLTFYLFSTLFFYRYLSKNSIRDLYIGAAIIAIGVLFRITTASFLFGIVLFLLITQRFKFLKKKELWIAALIFVLILSPYLIWGYFKFHGFIITQAGAWNPPKGNFFENGFTNLKSYFGDLIPFMFTPAILFLSLFIAGIVSFYKFFIGFDLFLKRKLLDADKFFLLLILFLLPILSLSFSVDNTTEDRYIINILPSVFIISSVFLVNLFNFIKKKGKVIAVLLILVLLGVTAYFQLTQADSIIQSRKDSSLIMKEAGAWINQNSNPADEVVAAGHPMISYYSERITSPFPSTEEEFEKLRTSNHNVRVFILTNPSIQPGNPEWSFDYPKTHNLTAVRQYVSSQNVPLMVLYNLTN